MSTKLVEIANRVGVPTGYTLAPTEGIAPQTIVASFDGTAASGPFLACCSFYAQDGKLIARCPTDSTLAVGDTAEVTFGPFLRNAAAGGATPTLPIWQNFSPVLSCPGGVDPTTTRSGQYIMVPGKNSPSGNDTIYFHFKITIVTAGTGLQYEMVLPKSPQQSTAIIGHGIITSPASSTIYSIDLRDDGGPQCFFLTPGADPRTPPPPIGVVNPTYPLAFVGGEIFEGIGFFQGSSSD